RALRSSGPAPVPGRAAQPAGRLIVPGAPLPVAVQAVHPRPPISGASEPDWRATLRDLAGPGPGVLRILAGDFNATLDHRELRAVLDRGYVDAADATGDGLRPTWPVGRRRPPITIDHLLVDARVAVREVQLHELRGSDHRVLVARLQLPAG
ncbi:MAG TPA: endonuclease/exonuclease/phosphatase family protein, partial [Baekduia sp.]|nr:endonuclease/exonuclease/phosphatase family protein [Baekduia sp.]